MSSQFPEPVKRLVRRRATYKAKVTNQFTLLNEDSSSDNVINGKVIIEGLLTLIQEVDTEICDLLSEQCSEEEIPGEVSVELGKQSQYITQTRNKLSSFSVSNSKPSITAPTPTADCKIKLPEIRLDSFSGEGATQLEYHSFITQFNNLVASRTNLSDSTKLTYLKSHLKGYASKLLQHLQVSDANFTVAVELLNTEFLNVEALVDDLFKKLLELKPSADPTFLKTKIFLGEVRCIVSDLKIYDFDFLNEKAGNKLISHIVFQKLPVSFQQELVRKIDYNYPTLDDIIDNYVDVIRTLNLKPNKPPNSEPDKPKPSTVVYRSSTASRRESPAPRVKYDGVRDVPKFCKFCSTQGHNMISCQRYGSYDSRKRRCQELKLCSKCSNHRHIAVDCTKPLNFPCLSCQSFNHISALCDKATPKVSSNFCVNSSDSGKTFLLPLIKLEIGAGKNKTKVRCLLDTGSQRSYLSSSVMRRLNLKLDNKTELLVNTFIDSDSRSFYETAVTVDLDYRNFSIPFLINDSFDLNLNIQGLKDSHSNIARKYRLQEHLGI